MKTAGQMSKAVDGFAIRLVENRVAAPRDPESDMLASIMAQPLKGEPFNETELAGMVRLLLVGGHIA